MKTLHFLRHAKAAEDSADGTDHARPLAKRGIKAAKALASYLAEADIHVDRVFCSTALRTRETVDLISQALPGAAVAYRDRLYLIAANDLMEFIQSLPDTADSVMIIGHNPAFHTTALALARAAAPGHSGDLTMLKEKYPTGALCSLQFDVTRWRQVKLGCGTLIAFVRPGDLERE